jgi:hypothetical protein
VLEAGEEEDRAMIVQTLEHWTKDPDLVGVRGEAIEALPEGERAAWRALWAEVDAMLERARGQDSGAGAAGHDRGWPTEPFAR